MRIRDNIYFLALVEGDLIINAAISKIIKEEFQGIKSILLFPEHPRLVGKLGKFQNLFDEVVVLPYMSFKWNIASTRNYLRSVNSFLSKLSITPNDILIIFDIFDLIDLKTYVFFKKHNAKIVTLSAFECNEFDKGRKSIVWSGTFMQSLYSLFLIKKVFWEYKVRGTQFRWLRFLRVDSDVQITIMKSRFRNKYKFIFKKLPYPPNILSPDDLEVNYDEMNTFQEKSILVLANSQLIQHLPEYYDKMNGLINHLTGFYPNYHVYIKDHPNYKTTNDIWENNQNVKSIKDKISAEELYIINKNKIKLVVSYGTTGLITASWFGIPGLNISGYLGFSKHLVFLYDDFMTFGENIKNIHNTYELDNETTLARPNVFDANETLENWINVLKEIVS